MFGKKNKKNNNTTREPSIDASELMKAAESNEAQPEAAVPEIAEEPVAAVPEVYEEPASTVEEPVEGNFEDIPEPTYDYPAEVPAAPEAEPSFEVVEEPEEEPVQETADEVQEDAEPIEEETELIEAPEEKAVIYSAVDDIDPDLLTNSESGEVASRKAEKKTTEDFKENPVEPIKLELDKSGDAIPAKASRRALVYVVIALIAVIAIVGFLIFTEAGLKEKFKSPLSINNTSIPSDEFSFMYHYVLIENGVDVFDKDTKEMLEGPSVDPNFKSNREYFLDQTAKELQIMQLLYDDATSHGYDIEEKHYQMANAYVDWLKTKASELGVPLNTYIQGVFGTQVTESCVRDTLAKKYFTEDYASDAKLVELQATEAEAKEAYEANRNAYDLVSYKIFRMTYDQRDQAFIDTAMLHANEIIEAMGHDPDKFEEAAYEYFTGDMQEKLAEPDSLLIADSRYKDIEHAEFRTWLFDLERTPGDTTIFTDEDGFPIVLCFVKREPQSTPLRSVRIFEVVTNPGDENGEGKVSMGDAQILAQDIYEYIKDDTTAMSVENLYTDEVLNDTLSITASSDTYPGKFEDTLDKWIFAPERKAGDKEIIESENGFYIIYFSSESEKPEWYDRVNSFIRMNKYQAFLNEMLTEYSYEFKSSGVSQIVDVP